MVIILLRSPWSIRKVLLVSSISIRISFPCSPNDDNDNIGNNDDDVDDDDDDDDDAYRV